MSRVLLFVAVAALVALAGCGGGGGSSSSTTTTLIPPPSPPGYTDSTGNSPIGSGNPPGGTSGSGGSTIHIVITGRIMSDQSVPVAVAGVSVSFGQTQVFTTTSGTDGTFRITLPAGVTVLSLFPNAPYTFSVSTYGITYFPSGYSVTYNGTQYTQGAIALPASVRAGLSNDLGTITVSYYDPGSGPPGPP